MKSEKTREEIVAEREAKKKAKMAKKKNLTGVTAEDSKPQTPVSQAVNSTQEVQSQKPDTVTTSPGSGSKSKKSEGKAAKKLAAAAARGENIKAARSADSEKVLKSDPNSSPLQTTSVAPDQLKSEGMTNKATSNLEGDIPRKVDSKGSSTGNETNLKSVEPVAEDGNKTGGMTKAEMKAARRMKQEMQRAAKAATQQSQKTQIPTETHPSHEDRNKTSDRKLTGSTKPAAVKETELKKSAGTLKPRPKVIEHKVKLFNHLYCDDDFSINDSFSHLHPAIISLGIQYAHKVIVGSNARCFSLMNALKKVIEDYTTPQQKEFARGLESYLQPCMAFLQRCRPLAVSMTNAMKHLKWQLTQLPNDVSDEEAKKKLQEAIDTYLWDQIDVAAQAICITVQKKISDGDVILTYGCSSLVQRILIEAHSNGTKFRVIIVDARPWCEGLQLLHRLGKHGVKCSYVLIGAASCMMREATRVLLGAHALLANGYVMSRAGCSQVALLAHSYNVPVLVCCETYKFCERVQTDALVYNEIGDPEALVQCRSEEDVKPLSNWRSVVNLTPLNLTYDVTPPDLVTAVVTELAILPCTSVPVILRIKPSDSHH